MTDTEYDSLKQSIKAQHNYTDSESKIDFSHQMITMAAIYNYNIIGESYVQEMLGWRGDTTLGDIPTMGSRDYVADLDAENICYIFDLDNQDTYSGNNDFQHTFINYYDDVRSVENYRVETFLEHTSVQYVEQILFNYANVETLDGMLANNKYRAAYNFIKNIKNYNDELIDYFETDKNTQ